MNVEWKLRMLPKSLFCIVLIDILLLIDKFLNFGTMTVNENVLPDVLVRWKTCRKNCKKNRLNATLLVRSNIKTLFEEGFKTSIHAMRNGWKPPPPLLKKTNQTLSYKFYVFKGVLYTQFIQNSIHISRLIHYTVQYVYILIHIKEYCTVHCKKQLMGHTGHTVRYFVITFIMSIYYTHITNK